MDSLKVRRATRNDREHIVRINVDLARETEDETLDPEKVSAGVDAVFTDATKGFYLVCECDGDVGGGLLVTTEWSDWRNQYYWWIQSVYVYPKFRKRGVYSALHRQVERLARHSGDVRAIRLYVDRHNRRAMATYEQLGMKPGRYNFYEQILS